MALRRMELRDFVIVAQLEMDFHAGFTALTGESGAGKSILIDALQLVLGARAEACVVREGAAQANLCAEFDGPEAALVWLDENGFDRSDDTLLLRRTIDRQGKSRAWINATPATATQLRQLSECLIDLHGQHAWQRLLRPEAVRALLDAYAGAQVARDATATHWQAWRAAQAQLAQTRSAQEILQAEQESLLWKLEALEKLAPQPGEWAQLDAEQRRLAHAQTLIDSAEAALAALGGGAEGGSGAGASAQLQHAQHLLAQHIHLDAQFEAPAQTLADCLAHIRDVRRSLQALVRSTSAEPARLAQLDARMAQWHALARRHQQPPDALPELLTQWRAKAQSLAQQTDLAALIAQEQCCAQAYAASAQALSQARGQAAPQLADAITAAMQSLGMAGGHFAIDVTPASEPSAQGQDDVLLRMAAHPGVPARPLGKVASGGELSRIALAIAVTTSAEGTAPTLIFDEVDAGVGGSVAHQVGRLMQQLGTRRQVLAVTHLPQVAACAQWHVQVAKTHSGGQTYSQVSILSPQARAQEVARMLGGAATSATGLAHAHEMLDAAKL